MTTPFSVGISVGDGSSIVARAHRSADDDKQLHDQDFQAPMSRALGLSTAGLVELTEIERHERLTRMREGTLGSVHSWEFVTAVDGPGTRLAVFLNGCGLRCLYCHNPDAFLMKSGAPVSSDKILDRVRRYRRIFRATDGGITTLGGEAMMQSEFVRRIFHGVREMDVRTYLDTSGFLGVNCDDDILDHLDLCLLNVKSGLPDTYKRITSRELQPTTDFDNRLAARGTARVWIRFVLVPGLTDDWDNIRAIGETISRWKNVIDRVEILPFHRMGRDKWHSPGLKYELEETKPPTPETTAKIREYFELLGFEVHRTGPDRPALPRNP